MKKRIGILLAIVLLACLCAAICACENKPSIVISCKGATADGYNMYLKVDNDIEYLDLNEVLDVYVGVSWTPYYDSECSNEAEKVVYLQDGENALFISTSFAGSPLKVYSLTVYKSFSVKVNYFVKDRLFRADTVNAKETYSVNEGYVPEVDGMSFEHWTFENGERAASFVPDKDTSLYAKLTPNTYTATYTDESNAVVSKQIVFGSAFMLGVPAEKEGYEFSGWSYNERPLTYSNGRGMENWNIARDVTLTPTWKPKKFKVSFDSNTTCYNSRRRRRVRLRTNGNDISSCAHRSGGNGRRRRLAGLVRRKRR